MLNKIKILKNGPNFGARVTPLNLHIFQKILHMLFFHQKTPFNSEAPKLFEKKYFETTPD